MDALISMSYLVRFIYPGDYGSFVEYDSEHDWDYCNPCSEWHITGNPLHQWRDSVIAAPKRADNGEDFLNEILNAGIQTPINIDLFAHKVVADGHHRVFAALDLGWGFIPARFSNDDGPLKRAIPISDRYVRPWNGIPYTESSYAKLLA